MANNYEIHQMIFEENLNVQRLFMCGISTCSDAGLLLMHPGIQGCREVTPRHNQVISQSCTEKIVQGFGTTSLLPLSITLLRPHEGTSLEIRGMQEL